MPNTFTKIVLFLLICLLSGPGAKSQIAYLGQVFQFQDGIYGMVGALSVDATPDRKHIYSTAQYGLSVFKRDTLNQTLTFEKSYLADDDGQEGLNDANCIKTSHDNRNVYVLSGYNNCISIYTRNLSNGDLKLFRTIHEQETGTNTLHSPNDMVISDDDRFVYVTTESSNRVLVFERDTLSGDLSLKEAPSPGYNAWLSTLRLSKDNKFLYVSLRSASQIVVYSRNTLTGLLTFVQRVKNDENGVLGLYSPLILELSNDDRNVYVLNFISILLFNRNTTTGELSYVTRYLNQQNGISGLAGSYAIAVSPDDRNVYTASTSDSTVVIFDRNASDGLLTFKKQMNIFHHQISSGYSNSAMLCEKQDLYLAEYWTSTLHTFVRDTVTGDLTYNKKYQNGDGASIKGLYRPSGAVESYDDKNVYTINSSEGIVVFAKAVTSGELVYRRLITSGDPANDWSKRIHSVACSKDNKYLYAISNARQICIFRRDIPNDSLILIDSIANVPAFNMYNFFTIKSSPDGRFFQVIPSFGSKICVFKYNESDGSLSFVETYDFQNNSVGELSEMKCSPDGKYLFTTSYTSSKIVMFKRNPSTGMISFLRVYLSFPNQLNQSILDFAVSNDGKNLYSINMYSKTLNTYSIDYVNDTLLPVEAVHFDGILNSQFYFSNAIDLSTDDRFVYLASRENSSIKVLWRNASTGKLTYMKTITEQDGDFEGFEGITSLVVSRNTRNLYLTSEFENSVSSYKLLLSLGPDVKACDGDTVVVSAGANYVTYKWSTMETGSAIKVTQSGVYSVEVTDLFGNMEYDTLIAVFYPLPELELGKNSGICQGDSILLDAGAGAASYIWNTGATSQRLLISDSGNYMVQKISEHGCVRSDNIIITTFPLPAPDLGVDTVVYKGQVFQLEVPGFESYQWYDGSTTAAVSIDSASFVTNPLLVWVRVTDANQCKNSDSLNLTFVNSGLGLNPDELPGLLISPNPFNDHLLIKCKARVESLDLIDIHGNKLLQMEINSTEAFFPTQIIPDGTYLLHLVVEGKSYFYKVIRK